MLSSVKSIFPDNSGHQQKAPRNLVLDFLVSPVCAEKRGTPSIPVFASNLASKRNPLEHAGGRQAILGLAAALILLAAGTPARADDLPAAELPKADGISLHLQATSTPQQSLPFRREAGDPASGNAVSTETFTATGFFGARLWQGGEIFVNPEVYQGWLLRDYSPTQVALAATVGNGEVQKGGRWGFDPYIARAYFSQTFGFGGEQETIKDDLNSIAGTKDVNRLTLTIGKLAANDFFDNNAYSHDTRSQFMNWALFDGGAFDYAADVKGYTWGAIADFNRKDWAIRAGYFLMPAVPNGLAMDADISRHGSLIVELEKRYNLFSQPGKLRLLGFENTGILGNYAEAVSLDPTSPNIVATQKQRTNYGFVVNFEQQLRENAGAFFRYSWNAGENQLCCFTDITESVSGGLSIKGAFWGRPDDTIGIAGAFNAISPALQRYLAAGGRGLLIGDGALPSYAGEKVLEAYYSYPVSVNLTVSADYQYIGNAAYFAGRSPISMFSGRIHVQF
jgi:high affinity Mn2+ porin